MTKPKDRSDDREQGECSNWKEIREWIDDFPLPETFIEEGEPREIAWAFRGVKDACYPLEPSIEREARSKSMKWAALETLVTSEFKARAGTHLSMPLVPKDELTWLAMMQHYSVPTRLLDFTYSPYAALYFALRNRQQHCGPFIRLYAVDVIALNQRFEQTASKAARKEERAPRASVSGTSGIVYLDPDYFATDRDSLTLESDNIQRLITATLAATGKQRAFLNKEGCVCAVTPRRFNPRLASQQGLFLLNGAEGLPLQESLDAMMQGREGWQRTVKIPVDLAADIERKLFQMNIHDQSLFPDLEGLAGLVRQKIRLHWR